MNNNPKLHICTVATEPRKNLEQLLTSCRHNGIQIDILGMGKPFGGYSDKLIYVQKYLEKWPDDDIVLFVDAYDVLILASPDAILKTFLSFDAPFVISGDRGCFPERELASLYPESPTTFRFLNSGTYIGYVGYLKEFFKSLPAFAATDDDQLLLTKHFLAHPEKYRIDYSCRLFLTTATLQDDELSLDKEKRQVHCLETHSTPCIIHGNAWSLWYQYIFDRLFPEEENEEEALPVYDKTLFLAILAKDPEFLPKYLASLEALDYDKKLITLYVNPSDSQEETLSLLDKWLQKNSQLYSNVLFNDSQQAPALNPPIWMPQRYKIPASVRDRSLQLAKEANCDYYLAIDCDNVLHPRTLKKLISKNRPIISPMLALMPPSRDVTSNFFFDVTDEGHYKDHPDYFNLFNRTQVGTYKVPVVFGTYLIQSQHLDALSYSDETQDAPHIVFSRLARKRGIDQYICNEMKFGYMVHYSDHFSEEQKSLLKAFLAEN